MNAFTPRRRVHIVGVGGAGMSGLALLLLERGVIVSGSDAVDSPVLEELRQRRVTTYVGHDARHVRDADVVLWSPAIGADNVEMIAAREAGATMVSRAQVLSELATLARVVGVTGTHGKTTATSMMVQVALAAGRDDGWLLGAPVVGVGANGHWGEGELIVELDESYGTFADVQPFGLALLNVEPDHLDHYGSIATLEDAFRDLVERTSGPVVAWAEDAGVTRVLATSAHDVVLVGRNESLPWRVSNIVLERRRAEFDLTSASERLHVSLRVTGEHNVANAAVIAVLARTLGIDAEAVVAGLGNFVGAPRRFQYRGAWRGVDVYEDYAHLPGEIAATLAATLATGYQRVTVVFQPHRVTRTLALVDQFASCFDGARHVVVSDVYDAGEANPTGVTGELVATAIRAHDPSLSLTYCAALEDVAAVLDGLVGDSDVILVLGAGDVGTIIATLPGGLT